jgi:death on curing protein
MTEWAWLTREAVEIFHAEQLQEHGGLRGLKDEDSLEAALALPLQKANYGEHDVFECASAYMFEIALNHPFSDGNKRTAFVAAYAFLRLNGFVIEAKQAEVIAFVLAVAAGEIIEDGAAAFFRDHCMAV